MLKKKFYKWNDFENDIEKLNIPKDIKAVYAIPRGGLVFGVKLSNIIGVPLFYNLDEALLDFKQEEILIVDDISDSGSTFYNIAMINNYQTISLFVKEGTKYIPTFFCNKCEKDEWIVFPWEYTDNKTERDGTNVQ